MGLSENEIKILKFLLEVKKRVNVDEIEKGANIPKNSLYSLLQLLKDKGFVKLEEEERIIYELTPEGKKRLEEGLPEDRLIAILNGNKMKIQDVKDKLGDDYNIAISWARKKRLIEIKNGEIIPLVNSFVSIEEINALKNPENADPNVLSALEKRGLLTKKEAKVLYVQLAREDVSIKPAITYLSHDLLVSGNWRNYEFREYNVEALPPFVPIGKKHYFVEFLEKLRDILKELGFTEVTGNFIEEEFYNFDLLFQPQDHPAREIHDSFSIPGSAKLTDYQLVEKVKEEHEKWWKYKWDENIAKRLVLRSQTTAVTARILASKPKVPTRVFVLGKVFRPDTIDATHLMEFHQLDGLVIESGFSFRDLLSLLKEIFNRLNIPQVKFKPAYFPFTEPSVEVYGHFEKLGWVELCGAGLLRPEIMESVGIDAPAGAWGMGVERIAMLFLGINDIRDLYSSDIEYLRSRKVEIEW
ncbi:MAG: phenylalanine--tRNA ligase subunit alpha [Sulfolobaceae archaeon]|nr:phenylalanine--tRNA ligase subunit alpha [Sulfolobaceae archaeon]